MKKTALLLAIVMLAAPVAMAADGAATYAAKCKMCHGPDGAKMAAHNLAGPAVQGKTDAALVTFLTTDSKHKPRVGDEATAKAVVAFLRTLKK